MPFDASATRAAILLYKDGSVHLCLDKYFTYHLTAEMLISFLASPSAFLDGPIDSKYDSSQRINPTDMPFGSLPGVTLVTYSYSRKLTIIFPEILQYALSLTDNLQIRERINMRSFISKLDHSDAKSFLLRYFLDFSKEAEKGAIVQSALNIDEDSFYSIMREIFNASIAFAPPKPPDKTVEQRLNEAVQQTVVEKKKEDYLISLPQYVQNNALPYDKTMSAVRDGKFKTAIKKGRNWFVDFREKPPKSLVRGKEVPESHGKPLKASSTPSNTKMTPEEMRKYGRDNNLYSNRVLRDIGSKEELDFYVCNGYHEVIWDGICYLICDIDLTIIDENGRTNEQRIMEDKHSPVTLHPGTLEYNEVHLHHLGQRENVLLPIEYHIHSDYHTLFHPTEPPYNLHTSAFEATKKQFWKRYVAEIKKHGCFDQIPYTYPKKPKE